MDLAGLKDINIPLVGGYRYSGSAFIEPIGFMDDASRDYIQYADSIRVRRNAWEFDWLGGESWEGLNEKLDVRVAEFIAAYPALPTVTIEKPWKLRQVLCCRDFGGVEFTVVKMEGVHTRGSERLRLLNVVVFAKYYNDKGKLQADAVGCLAQRAEPEGGFGSLDKMGAWPSATIIAIGPYYVCCLPNFYGAWPRLIKKDIKNNTPFWCLLPFVGEEEAAGSDKAYWEARKVPSMLAVFHAQGSPAKNIIWGLADSGHIRGTQALTEEYLSDEEKIRKLLTKEPKFNFPLELISPDGSIPNWAMAEYNGALFFWSPRSCVVLSQFLVYDPQSKAVTTAPAYQLAPFRGGCLGQASLAYAWNSLYVGDHSGAIYEVSRVMQSGDYNIADIFAATRVAKYNLSFRFQQADASQKMLQLNYDQANDLLVAYYAYPEDFKDSFEKDSWAEYAFGYNRHVAEGSTGWARLSLYGKCACLIDGAFGMKFAPKDSSVLLSSERLPPEYAPKVYYFPAVLESPFYIANKANFQLLIRSLAFDLDRLDTQPLALEVSCITEKDYRRHIRHYTVEQPFLLDEGRLNRNRFSHFASTNSFMVGMAGSYFKVRIARVLDPEAPSAEHSIKSLLFWHKETGGLLYRDILSD